MDEEIIANQPFMLENTTIRSFMGTIIVLSPLDMMCTIKPENCEEKDQIHDCPIKKSFT